MGAIRLGCVLLTCSIVFSFSALADEPAGELEQRIKAELTTYYKAREPALPWKNAVDSIVGGADDSASAGSYLRALLAQAAADEASGEAPWRATPFWGSSGENPARNLRKAIVDSLAACESLSDAATPAIAWVLEHEQVPAFQRDAAAALKVTRGEAADRLVASLISPETTNHAVLCSAIETAADRPALRDRAQVIAELAAHHHLKVRQAAQRVARDMGVDDLPAFDPVAAMRAEPVASLMKQMSQYVDVPPADARFIRVTRTYARADDDPYVSSDSGWQIERDETWIELFTPHGSTVRIRLTPDPKADADDVKRSIAIEELAIADLVEQIERLRAGGDEEFALSEDGGLTGQFEGHGASVYEAILGLWLYEAKHDELAARILLPALDTLYADQYLVEMVRHRMGRNLGRQMLVAFIGDRDYETAIRHAERIVEQFPKTQFHSDAVELAAELPKRADDFRTLTLPTPDEWTKLRKELSRGEQIDYLCVRLRLLNVFQWGQPGGLSYTQTQWPTPQGLSDDASWGGSHSDDVAGALINPYVELTGETGWNHPDGVPKPEGMKLTVDDIPRLAEHLREDWHILAVSFWRDFHPQRNLHTTREILVGVINDLANEYLTGVSRFTDAEATEAEIKRIQAWAAERHGRSRSDLQLDAVERVLAADGRYFDVRGQIGSLVDAEDKRVVPLLLRFLDREDLDRWSREAVLRYVGKLNALAALPYARKQHGQGSVGARTVAALIELEVGDPAHAVELLDAVLKDANYGNMGIGGIRTMFKSLIESGRDDARVVVAKQFVDDRLLQYLDDDGSMPALASAAVAAGEPGGLAIVRRVLDNDTNELADTWYSRKVSHIFADDFVENYKSDDPDFSKIRDETEPATDARVEALKKWLDDKIRAVKASDE